MKLKDYLSSPDAKSQTELAEEIGVQQPAISLWAGELRSVPVRRCRAIEKATNTLVTRKDLRPNDWHLIWPELLHK